MMKKIKPKAGQESVWDYPRPPKLEAVSKHLRIRFNDQIIADTNRGFRVLETSHPPVYYLPPQDIHMEYLSEVKGRSSFCEFKGSAVYYDLQVGDRISIGAAWAYPIPNRTFQAIQGYLAFYASKVDECYVADELVQAQEGDFYGGWITEAIVGPFKGGIGTFGW